MRNKLGYKGVIVSDDLDMHAIAGTMGVDTAAVQAIIANTVTKKVAHAALVEDLRALFAERVRSVVDR